MLAHACEWKTERQTELVMMGKQLIEMPVQIFLSPPVVLLSFLSRFALVR